MKIEYTLSTQEKKEFWKLEYQPEGTTTPMTDYICMEISYIIDTDKKTAYMIHTDDTWDMKVDYQGTIEKILLDSTKSKILQKIY